MSRQNRLLRVAAGFALPIAFVALVLPARHAVAEQNDKKQPINYSANTGDVNYQTKVGNLSGNVVITQGTMTIRADKDRVQAERGQLDLGNGLRQPAHVPAEARRRRRILRGLRAARRVRRREGAARAFDRALWKRGQDEIRSNYIPYNTRTELFRAEGRPDAASAPPDAGRRARARRIPAAAKRRQGRRVGGHEGGKAKPAPLLLKRAGRASVRSGEVVLEPSAQSTLSASELNKRYTSRTVVHDVSLDVHGNEVVGLLGPNGAGKTTCFYMIVGLVAADGGRIELDGEDMSRLPIHQRARRGLSYLPQEASIFRKLTVAENVRAILELQEDDADTIANRLDALLEDLSISHLSDAPAVSLSGGERRRCEIAGAGHAAALHPARRAVRRRGPDRRAGHPAHHRVFEGARDRRPHHRPQRPGNAGHLRPRLHHQRGAGARLGHARRDCL